MFGNIPIVLRFIHNFRNLRSHFRADLRKSLRNFVESVGDRGLGASLDACGALVQAAEFTEEEKEMAPAPGHPEQEVAPRKQTLAWWKRGGAHKT